MTPLQLAGVAAATGVGWGVVMALVAWLREGSEIVLMQSWIFIPAWLFGRAAGSPRAGALAGLAVVAGAVWTYELLPGWGLEVALRREIPRPGEREAIASVLDREDIVLLSTLFIGAFVGWGGGLRARATATAPEPEPEAAPAFAPPVPPAAPLWARLEAPRPEPLPELAPPVAPRPERGPRQASAVPWGAALLAAAAGTDVLLDRLFDMYTGPQGGVAIAFLVGGAVAAVWLARRYAVAMLLAGAVLASAFAAVQHAEYNARAEPNPIVAAR
jgi:hypothetical protein